MTFTPVLLLLFSLHGVEATVRDTRALDGYTWSRCQTRLAQMVEAAQMLPGVEVKSMKCEQVRR